MRTAGFIISLVIAACMVISLFMEMTYEPPPTGIMPPIIVTPQVTVHIPPPQVIRETRTEIRETRIPASGPTKLQWDLEQELEAIEREVRVVEEGVERDLGNALR